MGVARIRAASPLGSTLLSFPTRQKSVYCQFCGPCLIPQLWKAVGPCCLQRTCCTLPTNLFQVLCRRTSQKRAKLFVKPNKEESHFLKKLHNFCCYVESGRSSFKRAVPLLAISKWSLCEKTVTTMKFQFTPLLWVLKFFFQLSEALFRCTLLNVVRHLIK